LPNRFPNLRQRKRHGYAATPHLILGQRLFLAIDPLAFNLPAGLQNKNVGAILSARESDKK